MEASRVQWGAPINGTARELLAKAEDVDEDGSGENAREFLRYLLYPGPMRAADVFRDAEAHGYSKRQMQRARSAIGARIDKLGMRDGWQWSLPKVPTQPRRCRRHTEHKIAWHLRHLRRVLRVTGLIRSTRKQSGMTFKRGQSGNPDGRPPGIPDKRTALRELLLPHADALVGKAVERALAGDASALRICIEPDHPGGKGQGRSRTTAGA